MKTKHISNLSFILLALPLFSIAQSPISGIINDYAQVTAVNILSNNMTVADASAFSSGDEVLIIQMQGATINSSNSSSFGQITSYNGAGKYELAIVCEVAGNTLTFDSILVNTDYTASGLQIVRVPHYSQATVTAVGLTGQAWDGTTGGVLALIVDQKLLLNGDINMDNKGFRAGVGETGTSSCNFLSNRSDYYYSSPNDGGGWKGEGIAAYINNREYGKGSQANGGGGGNDHNAGGGGGSNGARGGEGGENDDKGTFNCKGRHPGISGRTPTHVSRVFMGGGGGAGHDNNLNTGGAGGTGGGIIIIIADTIETGAANTITTLGENGDLSSGDGAGGGGAGGSIHLVVNRFEIGLNLVATGGAGGNTNNYNQNKRCFGPGGGGGGGVIKASSALPASVSRSLGGGAAGIATNIVENCHNGAGEAAEVGNAGQELVETVAKGAVDYVLCVPLPMTWLDLKGEAIQAGNLIRWAVDFNNAPGFFQVERSLDGAYFQAIKKLPSARTSGIQTYKYLDKNVARELLWYRIQHQDVNGTISYSSTLQIFQKQNNLFLLYPNPIPLDRKIVVKSNFEKNTIIEFGLYDLLGKKVWDKEVYLEKSQTGLSLQLPDMQAGAYILSVNTGLASYRKKIIFK